MPAQVIVVKRPRRSLFAVPRALPDWLRSLWAVLFRTTRPSDALGDLGSADSPLLRSPLFPVLSTDESGAHGCVACELCVQVCPTRCLSMTTEPESESEGVAALRLTSFTLASGACIGCGYCAEACPEEALAMAAAGIRVELAPLLGGSGVVDLYRDVSRMKA